MRKFFFMLLGGLLLTAMSLAEARVDASALAGRTGGVPSHLLQKQRSRQAGDKAADKSADGKKAQNPARNALARKVGGSRTRLLYQQRRQYRGGVPCRSLMPSGVSLL